MTRRMRMRQTVAYLLAALASVQALADEPVEKTEEEFCARGPFCDGFELGGELYLVSGKTMVGPKVGLAVSWFRASAGVAFIYADKRTEASKLTHFVGNLVSSQVAARIVPLARLELNAGTGLDSFQLWGINLDERKTALSLFVEARTESQAGLGAALQARLYPLKSEGLELGVARNGHQGLPVLLVLSVYKATRR